VNKISLLKRDIKTRKWVRDSLPGNMNRLKRAPKTLWVVRTLCRRNESMLQTALVRLIYESPFFQLQEKVRAAQENSPAYENQAESRNGSGHKRPVPPLSPILR
jgi:hypothetical protein